MKVFRLVLLGSVLAVFAAFAFGEDCGTMKVRGKIIKIGCAGDADIREVEERATAKPVPVSNPQLVIHNTAIAVSSVKVTVGTQKSYAERAYEAIRPCSDIHRTDGTVCR